MTRGSDSDARFDEDVPGWGCSAAEVSSLTTLGTKAHYILVRAPRLRVYISSATPYKRPNWGYNVDLEVRQCHCGYGQAGAHSQKT